MHKFNLLTEDLIRYKRDDGKVMKASLPQVFAALMENIIASFPALRPHQRHAWHAFLVQLGAMAMHKAELEKPPMDADEWRRLIRGLTKDDFPDDEPWCLVVDDITMPAFMQPPASSEDKVGDYKNTVATPDELDMLVTSKNHDIKKSVALSSEVEDWIFALISLQTMGGYSAAGRGAQYHTISRVNGNYNSRPAFSISPSESPGAHARRDLMVILENIPSILNEYPMTDEGTPLVWILPWDGTEALPPEKLAPCYIEVCRRVRVLRHDEGGLYAKKVGTKTARINAKALKGNIGDPWIPINVDENKALTGPIGGFTYDRVVEYLTSGKWRRPLLLKATRDEQRSYSSMLLIARGIVRGQGKTEGYYERIIPISHKVATAMLLRESTEDLGRVANERIVDVSEVEDILKDAIATFIVGGKHLKDLRPDKRTAARKEASLWSNRLDDIVDATFFADLQDEFEADEIDQRAIRRNWLTNDQDGVVEHARRILHRAEDSLPCPAIQRYRARVRADSVFEDKIKRFLEEENEEWQSSNPPTQEQNPTEAQMTLFD